VAPILNGQCNGCHGSTADVTGLSYRLDFYDMQQPTPQMPDVLCGDAAAAIPGGILAHTAAPTIANDIDPADGGIRPRMPPLPASPLPDWQRETLRRWAADPSKGPPPDSNHAPTIEVHQLPSSVDTQLAFIAIIADADGDAVVGALEVGDQPRFLMNRAGSFAVALDSSAWPAGTERLSAVLCDGWTKVTIDLGPVQVAHAAN
jgi:hypothetical protein